MSINNIKSNVYKARDYNVEGKVYVSNSLSGRNVKIKRLNPNALLPAGNKEESMGIDLYSCTSKRILIMPHETVKVHTGIAVELPKSTFGAVFAESGLACKKELAPANKVVVVNSDCRDEVIVALHNHSNVPQTIEPMERVAQLVILPYIQAELEEVEELPDAECG